MTAAACLNCGTPLEGPYCRECGQRAVPARPTLRELAGDAFAELSGWDGKFVETFRLLLRVPGQLTREFIDGRRVRYIAPVRLYLTLSVLYFLVAAAAPQLTTAKSGVITIGPLTFVTTTTTSGPKSETRPTTNATTPAGNRTATGATDVNDTNDVPGFFRPILARAKSDPTGFRTHLYGMMPRVMFVLVPLLGAIIGIFYRGRHYPEHLYFAIHLASYVFLALMIAGLATFTHRLALASALSAIAQLSIPVYAYFALRRVYGGSRLRTILSEIGIGMVYLTAYTAAMLGLIYYAAVTA